MSEKVYQMVTERLLEEMERGVCPWRKPWVSVPAQNIVSGKAYRGINRLLLASRAAETGCPYFCSYKQAEKAGGHVRKGAKSEIAIFWKQLEIKEKAVGGTEKVKRIPLLRYYRVFSLADCEGIDWTPPALPTRDHQPDEEADRIVNRYLSTGGPCLNLGGTEAVYSPASDSVGMPAPEAFEESAAYYGTLFHELAHSTGHRSRLDREMGGRFKSKAYVREELTAEIGSAYLLAKCGLLTEEEERQSGAYLRSWISVLEADPKCAVIAAGRAERASEWILGQRVAPALEAPRAA